jgi:tetratricopeptide (TPR) repeat protein
MLKARSRVPGAAWILAALITAGCGGAEARKAAFISKGNELFASGNYEKARVEFRNALQIEPNNAEVRYLAGRVEERLGNIRQAAGLYNGAVEIDAGHHRARAALGNLMVLNGAPQQALDLVASGLESAPEEPSLLLIRAAANAQFRRIDEALADAEKALQLNPDDENAIGLLSGLYRGLGRTGEAVNLLLDAVERLPNAAAPRVALATLYADNGSPEKSERVLRELVDMDPDEPSHRIRLAQALAASGSKDRAEEVLRAAVDQFDGNGDTRIALTQFLAAHRGAAAAERELQRVVSAKPDDPEARFLLARHYENQQQIDAAEKVYGEIIRQHVDRPAAMTARGRLANLRLRRGDSAGAEALAAAVLAENARDVDALAIRGNLALSRGDPAAAISDLRSILRFEPDVPGVMRLLARAHKMNGEPALAEEVMRAAAQIEPSVVVRLDLAQMLLDLGKPAQAQAIVAKLAQEAPANVDVMDAAYKVALALGDVAAAKASAESLRVSRPDAPVGYLYSGVVAEAEGREVDALAAYEQAIARGPGLKEPAQAAVRLHLKRGRVERALAIADAALARAPGSSALHTLRGEVLMSLKRMAEATAEFEKASELDPKDWLPSRNLAYLALAESRVPDAVRILEDALSRVTDRDALQFELAALYERAGRFDEAIAQYEGILARDPGSLTAANNAAMLIASHRTDPESLARAQAHVRNFGSRSEPALLDTYGLVLMRSGRADEAVGVLERASAAAPKSATIALRLALAQEAAGQRESAKRTAQRALALQPSDAEAPEVRDLIARL